VCISKDSEHMHTHMYVYIYIYMNNGVLHVDGCFAGADVCSVADMRYVKCGCVYVCMHIDVKVHSYTHTHSYHVCIHACTYENSLA
jgi:hypothetical protein